MNVKNIIFHLFALLSYVDIERKIHFGKEEMGYYIKYNYNIYIKTNLKKN